MAKKKKKPEYYLLNCQKIAKIRKGKCLSKLYLNNSTKMLWECEFKHSWKASYANVKGNKGKVGTWCSVCSRKNVNFLSEINKMAKDMGGKCLSKCYLNAKSLLKFKCAEGHVFQMNSNNLRTGYWCNICSMSISERLCRVAFEDLLGYKFPKSYPKWLVNDEGNQMEFDGYSDHLKVAFEHQGMQHFKKIISFKMSSINLKKRKRDDHTKRVLCKKQGVTLVEINALGYKTKQKDLVSNIIKRILISKKTNPQLKNFTADSLRKRKIKFSRAYLSLEREYLKKAQNFAKSKEGFLVTRVYVHSQSPLTWKCKVGHEWEATYANVSKGRWCPRCAISKRGASQRLRIQVFAKIAKSKGGKLLSYAYSNARTRLKFRCEEGHIWQASGASIRNQKSWCPRCFREKRLSRLAIDRAKEKFHLKLCGDYTGSKLKTFWKCNCGNIINSSLILIQQKFRRRGFVCKKCKI